MTRIADLVACADGPTISFEFFPPKTPAGLVQLHHTVDKLALSAPTFVSVTYGAGGSARDQTRDLVIDLNARHAFPAMPHLTCMGHRRHELEALIDEYAAAGIDNILALAGDPPADGSPAGGDFEFASQLIALVRERGEFSVAVAAFPEGHPRSALLAEDRARLADKLATADVGISQFFFRADDFLRMRDDLAALGCTTPLLAGIMPMGNPEVIRRFARLNAAYFPEDLADAVSAADPADAAAIAADAAATLVRELLAEGVDGLHVYCLNRSGLALDILARSGLR